MGERWYHDWKDWKQRKSGGHKDWQNTLRRSTVEAVYLLLHSHDRGLHICHTPFPATNHPCLCLRRSSELMWLSSFPFNIHIRDSWHKYVYTCSDPSVHQGSIEIGNGHVAIHSITAPKMRQCYTYNKRLLCSWRPYVLIPSEYLHDYFTTGIHIICLTCMLDVKVGII